MTNIKTQIIRSLKSSTLVKDFSYNPNNNYLFSNVEDTPPPPTKKTKIVIKQQTRNNHEKRVENKFIETYGGITQKRVKNGIIDICSQDFIIECKNAKRWHHALGQIIAYGESFPNKKKALLLFNYDYLSKKKIDDINNTCNKYGVYVIYNNK